MQKRAHFPLIVTLMLALAAGNVAAADIAKGKRAFNKCKACHSLEAGKKKIGPSLHGMFGRTAGTEEGYSYSSAMKKAGANGLVWTEETLSAYLKKPKDYVKGTKMTFVGIKKETEMENLIAFLKDATKQ